MDLNDVEKINFNALGGADTITVNDLTGTDVTQVNLDLGINGTSDGAADTVIINATNGDDAIFVTSNNGVITVTGLSETVTISNFDINDRIVINGLGGNDVISATGLAAGIQFTADGGDGDDLLVGGHTVSTLRGGAGDDVLIGGTVLDVLDGGTGQQRRDCRQFPAGARRIGRFTDGERQRTDAGDERRLACAVHGIELRPGRPGSRGGGGSRSASKPIEPAGDAPACVNAASPWRMQMSTETDGNETSSELDALVMLLHFQGVAADREQIRHRLGTNTIGASEILRCAKDFGLKARACSTKWSRLAKMPLPAIATLRDGCFMVLAKAGDNEVLVQAPGASRPSLMSRDELLAIWDGGLS